MKAFKILLKEIKEENIWGTNDKEEARKGEVVFDYKNEEIELKKGAIVYYDHDYVKNISVEGKQYLSINPTNLVCQK